MSEDSKDNGGDALASIEADAERASELEGKDALEVLRSAKRALEASEGGDPERREALESRLDQRIRGITERDAYDGSMGSSMNPEDEEAP